MLHVSVRIYDALSVTHRTQPTTHVEIEWKSWKAYSGFWFDSHFSLLFLALKLSIVYPALYTTVRLAFGYDICLRVNVHLFNFNKSHSLLRNVSKGNGGIKRAKQTHKKTHRQTDKKLNQLYIFRWKCRKFGKNCAAMRSVFGLGFRRVVRRISCMDQHTDLLWEIIFGEFFGHFGNLVITSKQMNNAIVLASFGICLFVYILF